MPDYSELRLPLSERLPIVTYTNRFCPVAETLWMSPQVERLTGYGRDEWVGTPGFFESVLYPSDRGPVLAEIRASRKELRPFSRDYRLRARDGRTVWIHDESVPILDDDGKPELIQGYFIDITERKQLEQQLVHSQKTEAVGRLAGEVAHDFNNHLTAIGGHAQLIGNSLPEYAPEQRHVREIAGAVERATKLTRQLLSFARRQPFEPQEIDVDEVVRGLESMLRRVAGDDVEVVFELLSPERVHVDATQLEQVIVNLVANARDAMPDGGTVSIRTSSVSLPPGARAERLGLAPGDFAAIVVTDNGVGMDAETKARVFEPFFTTKGRERGTGLGLAIAETTIRRFNGAIELQSSPQHGSRFRILLPITPVG